MQWPQLRRSEWIFCLFVVLVTAKVYGELFHSDFIRFDDLRYVTKNPHVLAGLTWDGVAWAFTTFFMSNWHPLSWLSHMLDVTLFGVDAGGHHATSVLLHAANSVLLFAVLRSATRAPGPSAFVAAVFALHPTHVESVAWIAERKDVLSTCLGLLATACYIGWTWRGGALRYAAAFVLLAAGLAAKAMLVTLPFVFLLLDWWPLERLRFDRSALRLVFEKLPFFAAAAAISVVTYVAQREGGAVGLGDAVVLSQRLANAVMSYGRYVGKTLWPTDLALVYPHPYLTGGAPWQPWQVAAVAAGLAAASLAVLRASSRRYLAVGWLWFLGTLVPVIGIVHAGTQGIADRYTYLPCIGLYLMLAWGGAELVRSRVFRRAGLGPAPLRIAACLVLAALALASQRQVAHWRDTITLFEHSLAVEPGSTLLRNNLANEYYDRGNLVASIEHYRRVLAIDPDFLTAHRNLSNALRDRGEIHASMRHALLGRGIDLESGEAQLQLGDALFIEGNLAGAEAHYQRAVQRDPQSPEPRRKLAHALVMRGDHPAAIAELRELMRLAPGSSDDRLLLGQVLWVTGDWDAAIAQYRAIAEALPDDPANAQRLEHALRERATQPEPASQPR